MPREIRLGDRAQPDSLLVGTFIPVRRILSLGEECGAASGLQQSLGEIGKEHSLEARGPAGTWPVPTGAGGPCHLRNLPLLVNFISRLQIGQ